MKLTEVPLLEKALQQRFLSAEVTVKARNYNTRLEIVASQGEGEAQVRRAWMTPETMDYKALSMPEWLHRATVAMSEKLK